MNKPIESLTASFLTASAIFAGATACNARVAPNHTSVAANYHPVADGRNVSPLSESSVNSIYTDRMIQVAGRIRAISASGKLGVRAMASQDAQAYTTGFVSDSNRYKLSVTATETLSRPKDLSSVYAIDLVQRQAGATFHEEHFVRTAQGAWNATVVDESRNGHRVVTEEINGDGSVLQRRFDNPADFNLTTDPANVTLAFNRLVSSDDALLGPVSNS